MPAFNSRASLIVGAVFLGLSIAASGNLLDSIRHVRACGSLLVSDQPHLHLLTLLAVHACAAFVFFSGFSSIRFVASIAFFIIERTNPVANTAGSASLNVWGFCLYSEAGQNGDYKCTSIKLSSLFGTSFSLRPNIVLPTVSAGGVVEIKDVISALPFQGHPIAYVTLLGTIFFSAMALICGIVAVSIKGKMLKGWGIAINTATAMTALGLLSSLITVIATVVTTDSFVKAIESNGSSLGVTAKWAITATALTSSAAVCSLLGAVFTTRAAMTGGGSGNRQSGRLSVIDLNVEDRFKTASSPPPPQLSAYRSSAIDLYATTPAATQSQGYTSYPYSNDTTTATPQTYNAYGTTPYQQSSYGASYDTQTAYNNYGYATTGYTTPNQAYNTAAAAGQPDPTVVSQTGAAAPSTYFSNTTTPSSNQYATWQSPGYNPTTAELAYQQNYGHNVSDTSYYARKQQQQQQGDLPQPQYGNRW
ncbi:hypothetical protein HDU67_007115 [Dinochytrium kinnereticum]|nr:hypothetical protein HDU67_007115 [Dinochytrium kinnereticum]